MSISLFVSCAMYNFTYIKVLGTGIGLVRQLRAMGWFWYVF